MKDYLEKMTVAMELKGFAKSTQKTYLAYLKLFADFCGKHPESCGYEEVRAFLLHGIRVRNLSPAYINIVYASIKFFYQSALCRDWNMQTVPRIKKKHFLPTILTLDEVEQIIQNTLNLKHKAMLTICYTAGLRISECTHLTHAQVLGIQSPFDTRCAKDA